MGSFHGAEVCELVGLFILNEIINDKKIEKSNCGLYRDDGLLIVKKRSPRFIEQLRKSLTKVFQQHNLKVTIELSTQRVDFLDITMDLEKDEYLPFRKENAKNIYMNFNSNHPYPIKKEIPSMIQKRLSSLSKTKDIFDKIKDPYEKTLENSGFKTKLLYVHSNSIGKSRRKLRKKKVFYFNPPFSNSIKTNIGKEFLKLVSRHFPKSGFYGSIFNRNTIKISYSCMSNLEKELSNHNQKLLQNSNDTTEKNRKLCNCRSKNNCPVKGECLTKGVIYKATVMYNKKEHIYIGSTGRQFKNRFYEHTQSFNDVKKKESTRLSRFIHKIKNSNHDWRNMIKWEIVHRSKQNKPSKICTLCNLERLEIAFADKNKLLNLRSELVGKCRHFTKFYLKS